MNKEQKHIDKIEYLENELKKYHNLIADLRFFISKLDIRRDVKIFLEDKIVNTLFTKKQQKDMETYYKHYVKAEYKEGFFPSSEDLLKFQKNVIDIE